jgi:DNA repair exonuclease SbcCD ATPase subunit
MRDEDANVHIDIFHYFVVDGHSGIDKKLRKLEEKIMSRISDEIADVKESLDAAIQRTRLVVSNLEARVAELQARVDEGSATPEDEAALKEVKDTLDQLNPSTPSTLPEEPPA